MIRFHVEAASENKVTSNSWMLWIVPRKFLDIVGQDPSDSKSNQLHVDIFRFFFHSFEVYSIDSPKLIYNSPEVLNFNRFICN